MGSRAVQIVTVAFGVLEVILITVSCAVTSWSIVSVTSSSTGTTEYQYGLWAACASISGYGQCLDYNSIFQSLPSGLHGVRAMTVISCMLTYLAVIVLLLLGFGANHITFLQNEDNKSKIRLGVGVGMEVAGSLLVTSVSWFPSIFVQPNILSMSLGSGIIVGYVAGVLLLFGGGLLCGLYKSDIP